MYWMESLNDENMLHVDEKKKKLKKNYSLIRKRTISQTLTLSVIN